MNQAVLKNKVLQVMINERNGCFEVSDLSTGTKWASDPFTGSAGEIVIKDIAASKQVTVDISKSTTLTVNILSEKDAVLEFKGFSLDDGSVIDGSKMVTRIELLGDKPEVRIAIEEFVMDYSRWSLASIMYPCRTGYLRTFEDEGYLVIPYNQGCLIPSGKFKKPPRNDHHVWDDVTWSKGGLAWGFPGGACEDIPHTGWGALTMPWFGVIKGNSSFMCIMETSDDTGVNCVMNYNMQETIFDPRRQLSPYPRIASASPRWRSQMGKFGYKRVMTYTFMDDADHTEMAKFYRQYIINKGEFKSLKEKAAENADVRKLYGASLVNIDGGYPWYIDYEAFRFTWKDIENVADDMYKNLGIKKGFINTWGGYSKLPPETLPFFPGMGTEEELRRAVGKVKDHGYLYATYHGYPSLLSHSTSNDMSEALVEEGGGATGRWGARCQHFYMKYAKELPEILKITGQNADYTDVVTSFGLRECYDPNHSQTRTQCRETLAELFTYIRSLGVLSGSEVTVGWATPYLDYCKGGMYIGMRHYLLRYIHAPLFNLVYHDSMVVFDGSVGISRGFEYSPEMLECLAYGVNPIFSCSMPYYDGLRTVLKEESAVFGPFLDSVGEDELVSHKYIDEGYNVQKTVYSSGAEVMINTDTFEFTIPDGLVIPARGYVIKGKDGSVKKGRIAAKMTEVV